MSRGVFRRPTRLYIDRAIKPTRRRFIPGYAPLSVQEWFSPDAVLSQTNISGAVAVIQDDPDTPDESWMAGTGAIVLRVSFPTPPADLIPGVVQKFRVRVRP